MNREEFEVYVDHFNNKRYEALTSYFCADVTVEYFTTPGGDPKSARTMRGPEGFLQHYKALHENVREVMELRDFIASGDMMAVELYTEFHAFKDHPTFSMKALKKGDSLVMTNWVIYNLENGKMKRIRIAHFRMHDAKMAKFANA